MHAMLKLRVWDFPTRLFHWLLALTVPAALATGLIGGDLMVWHGRLGLFILGLVTFRLLWGFIGATSARFASFVRGPRAIRAYLKGEWRGVGHNPLGAVAVITMLALIALQIGSGLFANDDIAFQGPLADLVDDEWSGQLTAIHAFMQYGLIAMIVLHAAAIAFYIKVKRETLLRPMLTGFKDVPQDAAIDAGAGPQHGPLRSALTFIIAAALAVAAVYAASGALIAPPPPAAPVAAPAW